MDVGSRLRYARKSSGVSRANLAERSGISEATIARIEGGAVSPRVDTLERLLRICGQRLEVLPDLAEGIDRAQIREGLVRTPTGRAVTAANVHRQLAAVRAAAFRPAGVGRTGVSEGAPPQFDPETLLDLLEHGGVRFIVIGGFALNLYGSPRATGDLDICYERSDENIERLATVLTRAEAKLVNAPPDLDLPIDARRLSMGLNFTFLTVFGRFDCLGEADGVGGYEELARTAVQMEIFGAQVPVASIESLQRMKIAAGRPKDLIDLGYIQAIEDPSGS